MYRDNLCRLLASSAFAVLAVPGIACAQSAESSLAAFHPFSVPAGDLSAALSAFSRASGVQVVASPELVKGRTTRGVSGTQTARQALSAILAGTDLEPSAKGSVVVIVRGHPPHQPPKGQRSSERSADDREVAAASGDNDAGAKVEVVVVTGSRIARPELQSAMPISVTRADEMVALGASTATDMLQMEPALGIGTTLGSAPGPAAGIQAINLRNLGTNRSLTLIDGQRRVSSSSASSAVDIGMIPVGMIDRIEVVTGGAAAIYGADAVSGAVNIITKKDVTGFHITATDGSSDQGDARESLISLTTGGRFLDDRLRVTLGGTWVRTDPLYYTERYGTSGQLYYGTNPANTGPHDGIPDRYFLPDVTQIYYAYQPTFWVAGLKNHFIYTNGVVRPATYTTLMAAPGEFDLGGGGDGSTLNDTKLLRGSNASTSVMGNYSFEVTPAIKLGGYFSLARQIYAGNGIANGYWRDDSRTVFFQPTTGGAGAGGAVAYLDNPFLPDAVRQFMVANNLKSVLIERRYGNFPEANDKHDRKSFTVGQTVDGEVTDRLNFNLFFQYGRVVDHEGQGPVPYRDHWLAARDAIQGPNGPQCRDPVARAQGCVPFDIFSTAPPSQAVLDYAMAVRRLEFVNSQMMFGGSVSGALAHLPYGDLSVVAGVEHRVDKLKRTDDPLALTELVYGGGLAAYPNIDASQKVTEEYVEAVAPLLTDVRFFRRLELEGAYRHSNYNTIGGTETWKVGGSWEPVGGLGFRAVRSRSVRAPNFSELYSPQSTTLQGQIADPCEVGLFFANANRAKNCAALGIAAPGLPTTKTGPAVIAGGNQALEPETSNSLTVGMVFRPKIVPNFDLTVDYYNIDIANAIQQLSYGTILNLCVDLDSISNPYCGLARRDPTTHYPTQVLTANANTARLYTHGIDFGVNYHHQLGEGQLRLSFKANHLIDLVTETTPGMPSGNVPGDGNYQRPHFRASLLSGYTIGKFDFSVATRYIGGGAYDLTQISNPEAFPNNNKVPAVVYNDIAVRFNVTDRHRIGFGIKNIADTAPPQYPSTYIDGTMYDMVGRYIYFTLNANF
jgi:outer membrane receptor protein involved in Fe transport